MRKVLLFYLLMAPAPFVPAFVGAWSDGLGFLLFLFGGLFFAGTLLVATIVLTWRAARMALRSRRLRDWAAAVLPALMLAGIWFAALPAMTAGQMAGTWTRLIANRGHYEAIIAKERARAAALPPGALEEDRGVRYEVDPGPPVRVAFNPEGLLDNWSGIVFDPTGEVMLARGWDRNGRFLAPERVTKLFGGDLVRCSHLWGDYYRCGFT